jgi:hypothetical protein
MTTPENIKELNTNQIFVFGSNLNGNHLGGSASFAKENFGAEEGIGEGLTGKSYAFPTLNKKMEKVSKEELISSKERLYKYAEENKDKQFLVTKVGCGIAGFSEEEMKEVFKGEKPHNIVLPKGWSVVRGYKGFEKGLLCRGYQYELGKDFYYKGDIELCQSGFHFCKNLSDVYSYYGFNDDTVVCEVETVGDVIDEECGNKSVTNHLKLVRMLNAEQKANNNGSGNTGHSNTGEWNTGNCNTGEWNTGEWNTGHRNTGNCNTGEWNTGEWNTGYSNTGHSNTGHSNTGHRNTGHWNTGEWNTASFHVGSFNTKDAEEVLVFNKLCKKDVWDNAEKPNCFYFDTKQYIPFEEMTEEEKNKYPSAKVCGGYVKDIPHKEAWAKALKDISKEDIKMIKNLPNWDAGVWEEITGVKL